MLAPRPGRVRAVLDTDTYNEIDDQFALVQALLSPDRIALEAIYAAPFHNTRSTGPGDGMDKSYDEILRLLGRMGRSPDGFVFKGVRDVRWSRQTGAEGRSGRPPHRPREGEQS